MSQEVVVRFKETLKSTKELLRAVKKATNEQLRKSAPMVVRYLDKSFEDASKTLSDFVGSLDKRTAREQLELLRAYRAFLGKQSELIDGRISALEKELQAQLEL